MTNETEAPERIWASPADIFDGMGIWQSNKTSRDTEYTRADLSDAKDARIAELEAERNEAAMLLSLHMKRAKAAEAKLTDCDPYLKDHETPAQRLESNHKEALSLMKLLEREKRHSEVWVKAARVAEAKLAKAVEVLERIAHASGVYGVEANAEDQGADTLAYAHKSTCNLARATLAELKGGKDG